MTEGEVTLDACGLVLAWAVASHAKISGAASGDEVRVRQVGGQILFALADGSGSGERAASAARDCLDGLAPGSDIERVFRTCHDRMTGSRGAALALVEVEADTGQMVWAAVGDIHGVLMGEGPVYRARKSSLLRKPGTLGRDFSGILPQRHRLRAGDLLIVASDGVSSRYDEKPGPLGSAGEVAAFLLETYGRGEDDSTVLPSTCGWPHDAPTAARSLR